MLLRSYVWKFGFFAYFVVLCAFSGTILLLFFVVIFILCCGCFNWVNVRIRVRFGLGFGDGAKKKRNTERTQICILLIESTEETFQSNLARLTTGFSPSTPAHTHTHTCDTHHSLNVYAASERVCGHTKSAYFSDAVCFAVLLLLFILFLLLKKISIALGARPKYTELVCVLCSLVTCPFGVFFSSFICFCFVFGPRDYMVFQYEWFSLRCHLFS